MTQTLTVPGLGITPVDISTPRGRVLSELVRWRSSSQKFWLREGVPWPRDALGMVFLATATNRVGELLFPGEWTGHEPAVSVVRELPALPFVQVGGPRNHVYATAADRRRAMEILGRRRDGAAFSIDNDMAISMDEWNEARSVVHDVAEMLRPSRQRWAAVTDLIGRSALQGVLQMCLLSQTSTRFGPVRPPNDWNIPSFESRFAYCQMNPAAPTSPDGAGKNFDWIFVTEASLFSLIESHRGAQQAPSGGRKPRTMRWRPDFISRVQKAVRLSPATYPKGWSRDRFIKEVGYDELQLPMEEAKKAYAEALMTAGIEHGWSQPGKRSSK